MSAEQAKKEYVDTFFEVSTGACYPHYDACSMYSRSLQVFEPLKGMSIWCFIVYADLADDAEFAKYFEEIKNVA